MKLAETRYENSETGCCARLDVEQWNEKELNWEDQQFLKDHIRAFLHMPLNFGSVISRDHQALERAAAYPQVPFWLTDEVSPWGSDIYVATDRPVPGAEMVSFSGTFLTKVFEGPYRDVGRWIQEMTRYVVSRGRTLSKVYFYYATCPKCAKHFGKNQVVLFAKVA